MIKRVSLLRQYHGDIIMSVNETSRKNFQIVVADGTNEIQQNLIYQHIVDNGSKTRRQIARDMCMETSTVSARIHKMIELRLVKSENTTVCPISKKTVGLVEVI